MSQPSDGRDLLQEILSAAELHGEASAADHEVGDLRDALAFAWDAMTPAQRSLVHGRYFEDHEDWRT